MSSLCFNILSLSRSRGQGQAKQCSQGEIVHSKSSNAKKKPPTGYRFIVSVPYYQHYVIVILASHIFAIQVQRPKSDPSLQGTVLKYILRLYIRDIFETVTMLIVYETKLYITL